MPHYFYALRPVRPGFHPASMTPEEAEGMRAHAAYLRSMMEARKLLLAGPLLDGSLGVAILEAASDAEARALADADPAATRGIGTITVSPMRLGFYAPRDLAPKGPGRDVVPDGLATVGHFSNTVRGGGLVFVSGQPPIVLETGALVEGGFREQARQCLRNVEAHLRRAGCTLDDVVKTTVWLHDWADYDALNEAYREAFPRQPPARSTVQGARPNGQRLAIEAIAVAPPASREA